MIEGSLGTGVVDHEVASDVGSGGTVRQPRREIGGLSTAEGEGISVGERPAGSKSEDSRLEGSGVDQGAATNEGGALSLIGGARSGGGSGRASGRRIDNESISISILFVLHDGELARATDQSSGSILVADDGE